MLVFLLSTTARVSGFTTPRAFTRSTTRAFASITENVSFDTVAREWRCKWSDTNDKAALSAAQELLTSTEFPKGAKVTRTVCGGCLDFKVAVALPAEEYGKWSEAGHPPEDEFLAGLKKIEGVTLVETQTFTLMNHY